MKSTSQALIEELIELTKDNMNEVEFFLTQPDLSLNYKSKQKAWSALECIAHLNLYSDFYIPEIEGRIKSKVRNTKENHNNGHFESNWLGEYFAKALRPLNQTGDSGTKMKTLPSANTLGSAWNKATLEKFIRQQKQMLNLLDQARNIDLVKTKTSISITKLIKLRLGDTFRVVIYHNQRHIQQALRAIKAAESVSEGKLQNI
ncbi:MAG: hypothetical protein ACI959_000709 [Limisphaerales bacterium]|jgi:hypothetical protein